MLDDDVTTGGARALLALWRTTGDVRYRDGAERALGLVVDAQLASGAWPLVWRPAWKRYLWPTFEDLATINDDTTPSAVETLLSAAELLGRDDLRTAATRGGEFLLAVQAPPPRSGWAQQYDAQGRPAQGRRFEPPALASSESRYAIEALVTLADATGDDRYCAAITRAITWLASSALRPGCWPRFRAVDRRTQHVTTRHRTRRLLSERVEGQRERRHPALALVDLCCIRGRSRIRAERR